MSAVEFYSALGVDLPANGREATIPCFNPDAHQHGDRHPSCLVNRDTGCWSCQACDARGGPFHAAVALGRSDADAMALVSEHGLDIKDDGQAGTTRVASAARRNPPPTSQLKATDADVERYRATLRERPGVLERLAELRGWTREAVERLELGLDEHGLVTFPVRDAAEALVGLLRYQPNIERRDGPKLKADAGGRRELFPPPESVVDDPIYLLEGEPDAVAGASLGIPAVAVPGAGKWADSWAVRFAGRRVVVCMDCDDAGRRAADKAAGALVAHAAEVRRIDLEASRDDGYDLGDLLHEASMNGGVRHARKLLERIVADTPPLVRSKLIDGAELLDELATFVRRFVVMSAAQATAIALWIVHTHALDAADTTAYLAATSAEARSGKSRLLETLATVVARPLPTLNVSDAALFRSLAEPPPTLLFDEIDTVFGPKARDREDQRGMLNAGYRRGATVLRCLGDGSKQRVERFPVFCPKVLAGIGELPITVADRSIPVRLERRAPGERVERFRLRDVEPVAADLRDRVAGFADKSIDELRAARPDLPDELDDRAQDVVEPLLAIADIAGGEWPRRARQALVELRAGGMLEDESIGVRLLADVRDVFGERDRISTADLLDALTALDEAPWGDWYGKPLTSRGLGRLLKPYGIRSRTLRLGDEARAKGFQREQFEPAWARYLTSYPCQRDNPHSNAENGESVSVTNTPLSRIENPTNPALQADCHGVTDRTARTGTGAA